MYESNPLPFLPYHVIVSLCHHIYPITPGMVMCVDSKSPNELPSSPPLCPLPPRRLLVVVVPTLTTVIPCIIHRCFDRQKDNRS